MKLAFFRCGTIVLAIPHLYGPPVCVWLLMETDFVSKYDHDTEKSREG